MYGSEREDAEIVDAGTDEVGGLAGNGVHKGSERARGRQDDGVVEYGIRPMPYGRGDKREVTCGGAVGMSSVLEYVPYEFDG